LRLRDGFVFWPIHRAPHRDDDSLLLAAYQLRICPTRTDCPALPFADQPASSRADYPPHYAAPRARQPAATSQCPAIRLTPRRQPSSCRSATVHLIPARADCPSRPCASRPIPTHPVSTCLVTSSPSSPRRQPSSGHSPQPSRSSPYRHPYSSPRLSAPTDSPTPAASFASIHPPPTTRPVALHAAPNRPMPTSPPGPFPPATPRP
jgi:hypothetical protein